MTPLLHCTKWHKSDGDKPKGCSTLIKSCLNPVFLPILNALLSRTWTNTRDKSPCWFYLKKLEVFKLHAKNPERILCDLSVPVTSKQNDPEEVSRWLVCPWRQKFLLICTILTDWSPQKQCKCFLWQGFRWIIPPKEAVLILLPAWVPALCCVSTSSCAWQTGSRNWSTGNVFFLLLRFFSTPSFPKWLGGALNLFFFPFLQAQLPQLQWN